jgi:hypothetical protein
LGRKIEIEIGISIGTEHTWDLDGRHARPPGRKGYRVGEAPATYGGAEDDFDADPDSDFDLDEEGDPPRREYLRLFGYLVK